MNILICAALFLLITFSPAAAGQNAGLFTNQDLDQYKDSSDKKSPPATEPDTADTMEKTLPSNTYKEPVEEKKPKKYVIRYKGTVRRIIIPVTFNRSITVPMLLDTGAPGMHISNRLAKKLGLLDSDEGNLLTMVSGIAGTAPAVFTVIDSIKVGEAEDEFIPTIISELNIPGFEGLVGMDFMGKYYMQIDNKNRLVILEELPDSPLRPAGHDELWWRTTFYNFKSMRNAWKEYRDKNHNARTSGADIKRTNQFIDKQYRRADYLCNRLNVYASENSVPLEWR